LRITDDRFFVDAENQTITWIYYNPDSKAGGQYVCNNFDYALIREAAEADDFYDCLGSMCKQYLIDIDSEGFSEFEEDLNRRPYTFSGCNGDTKRELTALATKKNMDRSLDEMHTTTDKACAILQRTRDGDDLDPGDLYLTECAVNGFLTEAGVKKFDELHRRVMDGEYVKPWLHGVEPMTRDHEGYIYYKDKQVEHYGKPYVWSLEAARDLAELRNQCAYVESVGGEVSCTKVVWGWDNYRDGYGQA
jgi:hypothetical protein